MILAELKAETAELHARLDRHPLLTHLMARTVTPGDYRTVLAAFAGFVPRVEALLTPFSANFAAFGLDLDGRRRTALLATDLYKCGVDSGSLPICTALPAIETLADAFGCLYVLEGSSLGGQVIAKHVARHVDVAELGTAYFSSYGSDVGLMWREFRSALVSFVGQEASTETSSQKAIIGSASATFASLADWLDAVS